jgi:hypothetical protein
VCSKQQNLEGPAQEVTSERRVSRVDRGRGLQLSTSWITVHDLVPYFQHVCSHDEIMRWVPRLGDEEIGLLETYYREHKQELDEHERRVCAHREEQVRSQRRRFAVPGGTRDERLSHLRELLRAKRRAKRFITDNPFVAYPAAGTSGIHRQGILHLKSPRDRR